jgi:phage shock protein A
VRTIAERREIERRITAITAECSEWERKAEFALSRNREDLARGALMAKASASRNLAAEEQILASIIAGLAAQSEDLAKLQAKLAEAKTREKSLATRRSTATNQLKIRARLHDGRVGDAFSKFEKIERALDEMEGKVESYDLGQPRSLADEFADMEADETVKAELEALKAKLNTNNSTKE